MRFQLPAAVLGLQMQHSESQTPYLPAFENLLSQLCILLREVHLFILQILFTYQLFVPDTRNIVVNGADLGLHVLPEAPWNLAEPQLSTILKSHLPGSSVSWSRNYSIILVSSLLTTHIHPIHCKFLFCHRNASHTEAPLSILAPLPAQGMFSLL